jgi:hypothetical protein
MHIAKQVTGVRRSRTGFVPRSGLYPADLSDEDVIEFDADDDLFDENGYEAVEEWSSIDSLGENEV